jgi:predicted TIM-barrel fold metal-dependent hydrolase
VSGSATRQLHGKRVPTSQILLGSDNPYVPLGDTTTGLIQLGFSAADLRAIGRENALRLLPQLRNL